MRNQPGQLIILIEHHTIRPGRTPRVCLARRQNRELVVRWLHGEVEALIVVVDVRVMASADGLAFSMVVVAGLLGGVGIAARVAVAAAGVVAGTGLDVLGEGQNVLD